jgi:Raf kinase inhibitor-like YbhB/YbcL family protein
MLVDGAEESVMNRRASFTTLSLLAGTALSFSLISGVAWSQMQDTQRAPGPQPGEMGGTNQSINVTSSDFTSGGAIPQKYTCDGGGKPPALDWSGLPANTKSVAIVVDDPDAPQGTYVHWILYNVPPTQTSLAEGAAVPNNAKQGKNSKGQTGWTAPCPPSGTHHYRFKVYALSDMLMLDKPSQDDLTNAMKGKVIGQGELVGTYAKTGGKK